MIHQLVVVGNVPAAAYRELRQELRRSKPRVFRMTEAEWTVHIQMYFEVLLQQLAESKYTTDPYAFVKRLFVPLANDSQILVNVGEVLKLDSGASMSTALFKAAAQRYLTNSHSDVVAVVLSEKMWELAETDRWLHMLGSPTTYVLREGGHLEIC